MPDKIHVRNTCRVCGSKNLAPVLSLGEQYVSNFIDSPTEQLLKAPLELVLCDIKAGGCGLLQLKHTVSPNEMYKTYWYKSGINPSMLVALTDITKKIKDLVKFSPGDIVIDIGANDGTLLRTYGVAGLQTVGFEPASNLLPEASVGTTKIINDFFNASAFKKNFSKKAKAITSIAMFYDLEDPNKFVADICECLDDGGVWVIQMSYLPLMLEMNAFDNICHEHLEYYSLLSLESLLKRHNLEVFDIALNDVNGGSFRVYIRKSGAKGLQFPGGEERVKKQREHELGLSLDTKKPYDEFSARVQSLKTQLCNFVRQEVANGKKIYVYGASTKGNTLLQYYGLDSSLIVAAAEKNEDKFGKKTVGTLIPIISDVRARVEKPDYFLVLPWHFIDGFRKQETEFLNRGGKFIVPLPKFEIIST